VCKRILHDGDLLDKAVNELGLVAAVQAARGQLGHGAVSDADLHVLLFGPGGAGPVEFEFERILSSVETQIGQSEGAEPRETQDTLAVTNELTGTPSRAVDGCPGLPRFRGHFDLPRLERGKSIP
jgi:hypothetical protein